MKDPFDSPVPYLRWAWQHYYELAWLRWMRRGAAPILPHHVEPILERQLRALDKVMTKAKFRRPLVFNSATPYSK